MSVRLRHRISHALSKPPRVIAWKIGQRALRQLRRYKYWEFLAARLRSELGRISVSEMRLRLSRAPQLLRPGDLDSAACAIREDYSEESTALVNQANKLLSLEFSYFGWTRKYNALPLPWCSDWRSGRKWEQRYYADYDYSEQAFPSDVKSCWEPSRFHFGLRLGQAYRLTGDVAYRTLFFQLLRDWHDGNPVARSINWTSPLEVAIRGVNIAAAASLFADAEDDDLRLLVELLAVHGAFLFRNIEYTDVRGNHYTGNLLGLLTLGMLLEGLVPEAASWRQYAEARIDAEILLQFTPDGVNREKSLSYHRFVTEMFLLCAILLERAGTSVSEIARRRLRAAVEFTAAYIRPDGRAPVVGDSDDARALPLSGNPIGDHSHLITAYEATFGEHLSVAAPRGSTAETLWLFGQSARSGLETTTGETSLPTDAHFPDGGFCIARHSGHYLFVDAGGVGLQSGGCHGHHDMLSFELALDGVSLVVDSGSPEYTGDVARRNLFRRTAAHNTARVDMAEQGGFDESRIWHLGGEAAPTNIKFTRASNRTIFEGGHAGYERLEKPVMHRRRLILDADGQFDGVDCFEGNGNHRIEVFFHFASDVQVVIQAAGVARLMAGGRQWQLSWEPEETETALENGEVSPFYGVRSPAKVLVLRREGQLPWKLHFHIERT